MHRQSELGEVKSIIFGGLGLLSQSEIYNYWANFQHFFLFAVGYVKPMSQMGGGGGGGRIT